MHMTLYTLPGPWEGQLSVAGRPHGGDALHAEIMAWRSSRICTVVSLLSSRETAELELQDEEEICFLNQIELISFPIEDRGVPSTYAPAVDLLRDLDSRLARGENILIHACQGVGRPTIIAAGVLISRGFDAAKAVKRVNTARGVMVPETREQLEWLSGLTYHMTAAPLAR